MPTVQLRRYEISAGEMDEFLAWWRQVLPVRRLYGFRLLFAFVDRERNEFLWAVSHDGDFDRAEIAYNDSPERAAVADGVPNYLAGKYVVKVESVLPLTE